MIIFFVEGGENGNRNLWVRLNIFGENMFGGGRSLIGHIWVSIFETSNFVVVWVLEGSFVYDK